MSRTDREYSPAMTKECLRFVGEMSASISHEIRNKLAVINEKAGLLQDMAIGLQAGRAIDPDRLELQAKKVGEQVRDANRIVGDLNRLAHSADDCRARVDLSDLVGLAAALHRRKAAMSEVEINTVEPIEAVPVTTNPILLENLLGACIDIAVLRIDDSRTLAIAVERSDDGGIVCFQNLEDVDDSDLRLGEPDSGIVAISTILGASLATSETRRDLILTITSFTSHDGGSQT